MQIANNLTNLDWWSFALYAYFLHPFIMIMLCLLSVLVVLGNLLVVSAIWHENQLHSVTNYLIASLAAADCLVGAVVMPSSIISDIIIGSWTFGAFWCDLWHSLDVLASTASIMNLCAISYDRYLAITDPISYPTRMTPRIVALIIVSLWTCSSLISFPAILWWRAVGEGSSVREVPPSTMTTISPNEETSRILNSSTLMMDTQLSSTVYKCEFTDDTYYLLFSSSVSFYIPLCVMLYAYYRIYKAAIQQTRFLKHGSKQVMIGRRKKSKRSRHISEHSAYVDSERTGTGSLLYSEGLSNMESYDRQHLVLRAHRGGGHSAISRTGGTESSGRNVIDQKRSKDPHNESVRSKSNLNTEHDSKVMNTTPLLDESNQPIFSKSNMASQTNTQHPSSDQGSIRRSRLDSINARRDKLKVESQRFDSRPLQSQIYSTKPESMGYEPKSIAEHEPLEPLEASVFGQNHRINELGQIGRPSIVTITNGSNSIDVSIVEPLRTVQSTNDKEVKLDTISSTGGNQESASKFANYKRNSISDRQISSKNNVETDEDASDEVAETGSSTSSGSYGTGSIISVMVRPQQSQQQSMQSQFTLQERVESSNNQPGNFVLRRALSFRESKRKISTPKLRIEETMNEPSLKASQQSRKRYRASYGDQSSISNDLDAISKLKTSKTLNIRSLVKLTRTHGNKNKSNQCNKADMIPPPSLLPLMSMHSDTSTDSSIAGAVGSGLQGARLKETSQTSCGQPDIEARREKGSMSEKNQNHDLRANENQSIEIDEANCKNRLTTGHSLTDRNASFKADLERGEERTLRNKAQMIYYDSDKLIQSIVDLTDIHFIDCANIKDVKNHEETVALTSGMLTDTNGRPDLDRADQAQLSESVKANITRQHRSVGKKLSKLAKERKAAKTLGIVVGVFILCWLPFFIMNILIALCGTNCIYKPQVIGPVFTWLGWLNSAMNPVIYACWSRDFRRAFRRVLCTWVEFVCPYDGAYLARKLRLKKSVHKEQYLSRTVSSIKGNTSTNTTRSGVSIDKRGCNSMNGSVSRSIPSDQ